MKEESVSQLKALIQRMEELTLSEKYAKEYESLVKEAIDIITLLEEPANRNYTSKKQSAVDDLSYEYKKYIRTYNESGSKKEKLQVLKDSRTDVMAIIYTVLSYLD